MWCLFLCVCCMSLNMAVHMLWHRSTPRAREGEKPGVVPCTLPGRDAPHSWTALSSILQDRHWYSGSQRQAWHFWVRLCLLWVAASIWFTSASEKLKLIRQCKQPSGYTHLGFKGLHSSWAQCVLDWFKVRENKQFLNEKWTPTDYPAQVYTHRKSLLLPV